jgi:hypothetical protein
MGEVKTANIHASLHQLSELFNAVGLGSDGTDDGGLANILGLNVHVHLGNPLKGVRNSAVVGHFFAMETSVN